MATFAMPGWFVQRVEATAIGQFQQQAAQAASAQWLPISECECCGAPIAQDEDLCEKCKQEASAAKTPDWNEMYVRSLRSLPMGASCMPMPGWDPRVVKGAD